MKKTLPALWLLAVLFWNVSALGQTTYRCNSQLVSVGDRKFEVKNKCGEPMSQEFVGERTYLQGGKERTDYIEEWIYDLRYGFYDILTFEGGRLVRIEAVHK